MHIIEPALPHIIYSAARWNAILSARGYISLIHRTTITTHLIPECSLLKKKKEKEQKAGREGASEQDQMYEEERMNKRTRQEYEFWGEVEVQRTVSVL